MLKSLFNKVAGVKHRFFPVKLANFLRTSFLKSASGAASVHIVAHGVACGLSGWCVG